MDTQEAFSRNIGWVTADEAQVLANKHVAIAGMGGVGGHYAEMMARLGVRNFTLADFDHFEIANFNRQNGSGHSQIGKKKLDVIAGRIRDINPKANIRFFADGVNRSNLNEFLEKADVYLDGLDFFVLKERLWVFNRLRELGIPGITVAPIGMGASLVVFTKDSMSFEEYFGYTESTPELERGIRFLVGLSPTMLQRHYQADRTRVDFKNHKVPSMPMGCYLAAGVAGTTALKVLLNRGPLRAAPWSLHYDAYLQTYRQRYTFLGAANPLQKLKCWVAYKMVTQKNN